MLDLALFIGSHLIEGFEGTRRDDPGVEVLRTKAETGQIGGTILFSYNIESPDQLQALTNYIASWQIPEVNRPLLVAVDQEGGKVERLTRDKGFHGWPSAKKVGSGSPEDAQNVLIGLPEELEKLGINVNFAPVVDLDGGPRSIIGCRERCFSNRYQTVADLAARSIEEHRKHGVLATVKHFPGLGNCTGDTHDNLIDGTNTWSGSELVPYEVLLKGVGIDAVMSTHMVNKKVMQDGVPLTFSRKIMHDSLRDELGFKGVLFTDDLGMGSIVRHYDIETVVIESLFSGHDMLVFGQNSAASSPGGTPAHVPIHRLFERARAAVAEAVGNGRLTETDLNTSNDRLRQMREKLCRHIQNP